MSRTKTPNHAGPPRFPRVSGDEPGFVVTPHEFEAFSPRERG